MNHICVLHGLIYIVINNNHWVLIALNKDMYPTIDVGFKISFINPTIIKNHLLNKFQKEKI